MAAKILIENNVYRNNVHGTGTPEKAVDDEWVHGFSWRRYIQLRTTDVWNSRSKATLRRLDNDSNWLVYSLWELLGKAHKINFVRSSCKKRTFFILDVVDRLSHPRGSVLRPKFDHNDPYELYLTNMVRLCWDEHPINRPSLKQVQKVIERSLTKR